MALYGHTKIELTDVHTGAVEVVEKHNFITGALAEWLRPMGVYSNPYRALSTRSIGFYYGALALFDTPIEGDENTFFPQGSNHPVGYADFEMTNTTAAQWLGSYNMAESQIDTKARRATFVYDFATSQGNGQIASVCLMPQGCGATACFGVLGSEFVSGPKVAEYYKISERYPVDRDDDAMNGNPAYVAKLKIWPSDACAPSHDDYVISAYGLVAYDFEKEEALTFHTKEQKLSRWSTGVRHISLFRGVDDSWDLVSESVITLPEGAGKPIQSKNGSWRVQEYDAEHICLFLLNRTGSSSAYTYCYTMAVYETATGALSKTVSFSIPGTTAYDWPGLFYHDGFILLANGPNGKWFRISEENPTDIQEPICEQEGLLYSGYEFAADFYIGGMVYLRLVPNTNSDWGEWSGGTNEWQYVRVWRIAENSLTKTAAVFGTEGGIISGGRWVFPYSCAARNSRMIYLVRNVAALYGDTRWAMRNNLARVRMFLSTINNLAEPVIKTADKTMKITYTLQEVEDTAVPPEEGEA